MLRDHVEVKSVLRKNAHYFVVVMVLFEGGEFPTFVLVFAYPFYF